MKNPRHDPFNSQEKNKIGKATDNSDEGGQNQMKGFFIDPEFFADGEGTVEMAPDKGEKPSKKTFSGPQPFVHANNI
jgi:hypothetical protein